MIEINATVISGAACHDSFEGRQNKNKEETVLYFSGFRVI